MSKKTTNATAVTTKASGFNLLLNKQLDFSCNFFSDFQIEGSPYSNQENIFSPCLQNSNYEMEISSADLN
jgi:hypothetical protein